MTGDPGNDHPDAWINSDDDEAIGRIVQLIREIRANIVIPRRNRWLFPSRSHSLLEIVTGVFAAGNPEQYPGSAPRLFNRHDFTTPLFPIHW